MTGINRSIVQMESNKCIFNLHRRSAKSAELYTNYLVISRPDRELSDATRVEDLFITYVINRIIPARVITSGKVSKRKETIRVFPSRCKLVGVGVVVFFKVDAQPLLNETIDRDRRVIVADD